MEYDISRLRRGLSELPLELSDGQYQKLIRYYELLTEKNKVMNLTAITEFEDVVEKHFLDSLSLVRVADISSGMTLLDMGTGAGFPGIPLKIAFPDVKITLADSLNKRIGFLQEVIAELGLTDVSAIHARAEELAENPAYREKFDCVVSRAVANLSTLSEYCIPFVKQGGQFIAYKSADCGEEVAAAEHAVGVLGGRLSGVEKFMLGDAGRAFVVIKKEKPTPKKYPRKAGTPAKNPL